jgi:hypothetical protein
MATSTLLLTIFVFHTNDVWLNLHQFLYVLGRHEIQHPDRTRAAQVNAPKDEAKGFALLSPEEQRAWRDAVSFYARDLSKLDTVFDAALVKVGNAVASAGDRASLNGVGIEPALAAVLEKAMPIYRKGWWAEHEKANRAWAHAAESLVAKGGEAVLNDVTRIYQLPWPEAGFPIHVSAWANWAGAFSTSGNLLIISSLDEGNRGLTAFETSYHEAMHQWDSQIFDALALHARQQMKKIPYGLTHAMIWMTVPEAIARVSPGYVGIAESLGLWRTQPIVTFKPILEEAWKPYLAGKGTRDDALAAIVTRLPN